MIRRHESYYSQCLGREMELLWFGDWGRPVLMLPTSAGRYNENEDFGLVGALHPRIEAGEVQVISLDAVNRESWAEEGLAPEEKLRRQGLFDRFLSEEFLPYMAHRTEQGEPVLFGASLGAWQVVTFAARHPEQVGRVVAMSGFYSLSRLLQGWWSEEAYYFSPEHFVPNLDGEWTSRLARVEWLLATGEHDSLVEETRNMCRIFRDKGIAVHEEIWSGVFGHDWPFWREHLPRLVI
jgi:esterase/lipase superfamily enzyme